ncbi:Integrase/recombinase [Fructobacillus tropaeoli]|uniref:site-specific integrase n=1 Tax=Fructobacillus tropaeoli TaxID=709323 RepID=UPI002DB22CCC|nr:Integrase/recombinase [Fructobacillus tropaeoli]
MASIYKRSNGWGASVYYQLDGKDKRKVKSGFNTKAEAQQWANKVEFEKSSGKELNDNRLFIDEFKQWYEIFKEPNLYYKSAQWYETVINIITEKWSGKKVNQVKTADMQKLLNEYAKDHVKSSVRRIRSIISAFVRYAVSEGIIYKDFTVNTTVYSEKESKPTDLKFLEIDEMKALLEAMRGKDDSSARMIYTSLLTGMRYSEVAALTTDDIDFDQMTISVNKSWDSNKKVNKPTKTKSSNRIIPIPEILAVEMETWNFDQGQIFNSDFSSYPPTDNGVNKRLRLALKKLHATPITFHGLRHTFASFLILNDVPIQVITEWLGHADSNITIGFYAHLMENKRASEKERVLSFLNSLE